jgi:hypothetical protein
MSADATCAICGRTILAGEQVRGYVEDAHEHSVCELCVARAEYLGWRSAGEAESERASTSHESRSRLRGLLRGRARRPSPPAVPPASLSEVDPAAPPQRTRQAAPLDALGPNPAQRAVARFNGSDAGRTVAGLRRTLGRPWVSVGALAGAPDEVRITVAWELSWYQWGVDTGDELRPVFPLDKGQEIDQLDHASRQWNATMGEDGKVSLGTSLVR